MQTWWTGKRKEWCRRELFWNICDHNAVVVTCLFHLFQSSCSNVFGHYAPPCWNRCEHYELPVIILSVVYLSLAIFLYAHIVQEITLISTLPSITQQTLAQCSEAKKTHWCRTGNRQIWYVSFMHHVSSFFSEAYLCNELLSICQGCLLGVSQCGLFECRVILVRFVRVPISLLVGNTCLLATTDVRHQWLCLARPSGDPRDKHDPMKVSQWNICFWQLQLHILLYYPFVIHWYALYLVPVGLLWLFLHITYARCRQPACFRAVSPDGLWAGDGFLHWSWQRARWTDYHGEGTRAYLRHGVDERLEWSVTSFGCHRDLYMSNNFVKSCVT